MILTLVNSHRFLWTPEQATPALWLDAADADTITESGGDISQWDDKSGNNRHATQGTPGNEPSYTTPGLNGLGVVSFNGSPECLDVDLDFLASVDHSAFIVITDVTAHSNIYGAATGSAGANSLHVGFIGGPNRYRMNYWGNDWNQAFGSYVEGDPWILEYLWDTGAYKTIYATGNFEGDDNTPLAGTIGTMAGGGRIVNVVGQGYTNGDIGEIVMFTSILSTVDRQRMEGYLAWKWGLQGDLPGGHPYENEPPVG